jgi:hypothetical protein
MKSHLRVCGGTAVPDFRDRVVHYPSQLDLDRQQLGSHPFLDRLAPDDEGAPFA